MRTFCILGILFVATMAADLPLLQSDFQFLLSWDDPLNILQDPLVNGGSLEAWTKAWTTVRLGVYEPVGLVAKATVARFLGIDIKSFQLTTLAIHFLNACLLFIVGRRLIERSDRALGLGLRPEAGAALASMFFLVHPLRVEVVAWASGQSYALAGSFFLLSLWIYLQYAERIEKTGRGLLVWSLLFLSFVTYCMAVASKSAAIFLPVALLAVDRFPMQRPWSVRLLLEKSPYFLAAAAFAWMAVDATADAQKLSPFELSPLAKTAYAFHSLAFHLAKAVWPTNLHALYALYDRDVTPLSIPLVYSFASIIGICVFAALQRSRAPWFGSAWWIFVAGILPVSGILAHGHLTIGADRYTYLPLIGASIALGAVATSKPWMPAPIASNRWGQLAVAVWITLLACLVTASNRQLEYWRNDESLWTRTVEIEPDNALALNNLGYVYLGTQRFEAAVPLLIRALETQPNNLRAILSLGVAYQKQGRNREAVGLYRVGLEHHPENPSIHSNLSVAYGALGRKPLAARHAELARRFRRSS